MAESGWMGHPRSYWTERLQQEEYDVIIIGGGITGAGIAREASLAGLKVAVLEGSDFAAGTSSRSTKLIHGGLRYLAQGHLRLVREAGSERAVLRRLAPHLVRPVPFVLPIYKGMQHGRMAMSAAIWLYDRLAGVAKEERRQTLSVHELLQLHPALEQKELLGGVLYHEYVTDDARLTLATLQSASALGAVVLNDCPVRKLLVADGTLCGVIAHDLIDDRQLVITGRLVVNAAGPWIEQVLALEQTARPDRADQSEAPTSAIPPAPPTVQAEVATAQDEVHRAASRVTHSRGIHLSFPAERLPLPHALAVQTADRRLVFLIPKGEVTYVGTTDKRYAGDLHHPEVPAEEIDYLLRIVNRLRPDAQLTEADVIGIWSGVRPLVTAAGSSAAQDTKDVSREDEIWVSPSGLITIAGGKLTAYRKMAERVLSHLRQTLGSSGDWNRWQTLSARLPLYGAEQLPAVNQSQWWQSEITRLSEQHNIGCADATALLDRFGDRAEAVLACGSSARIDPHFPLLCAEIHYMVRHESANHLQDLIARRTELGRFRGRELASLIDAVSREMALLLDWTEEQREREVHSCQRECHLV